MPRSTVTDAGVTVNGTTLLSATTYEPSGPANGWSWGNGTSEVRAYNTDGNLAQINAIEAHTYGYDNALRISGINQQFEFDALELTGFRGHRNVGFSRFTMADRTVRYTAEFKRQMVLCAGSSPA